MDHYYFIYEKPSNKIIMFGVGLFDPKKLRYNWRVREGTIDTFNAKRDEYARELQIIQQSEPVMETT